jgi:DNA-binding LytR/AlgR family response regulator
VIIDDEPLARECISNYIESIDFLQLIGTGSNPLDLNELLSRHSIDVIFLDIQMPFMNGIDFLKITKDPPMVIITTAYPTYALEGFRLDVMDYLVKPITFDRFFHAVTKARDYQQLLIKGNAVETAVPAAESEFFFIKCDYRYERIYFNDILYIEALQNYVTIFTKKGKYITLLNLKTVEENLDSLSFIRIHKSYIVSISKIETIENNEIIIQSHHLPISRNYRDKVIERVVNDKLWKR